MKELMKISYKGTEIKFYSYKNEPLLISSTSIGLALGYASPRVVVENIYKANRKHIDDYIDLLDENLKKQYFNCKGALEICRHSSKEEAGNFSDWIWKIHDMYISAEKVAIAHERDELRVILEEIKNKLKG